MSLLTDTTQRCRNACPCVHVCVQRPETKSNNSTFHPFNLMNETFFFWNSAQAVTVRQPRLARPSLPSPGTSNNLHFFILHPSFPSIHLVPLQASDPHITSVPTRGVWQLGPTGARGKDQLRGKAEWQHSVRPGEPVNSITYFTVWPKTIQVHFGSKLIWKIQFILWSIILFLLLFCNWENWKKPPLLCLCIQCS